MKKIYSIFMMGLAVLAFSACESDRDSNPTLLEPDTFVLNVPPYAENNVYDLENSEAIEFTCSQPDYGFPIATTYTVQMALDENFTEDNEEAGTKVNYVTLSTKYTSTKVNVDAVEFALGLVELWGIAGSGELPDTPITLYVRMQAALTSNGSGACTSNVIELPRVLGYKAEAPVTLPETMYLIGGFAESDWNTWLEMTPVTGSTGKFSRVITFGAGAAGTMKFNMNPGWDGNQVAYFDGLVPEESKKLADVSGVDDGNGGLNIQIGNAGTYEVVVTVKVAGTKLAYTLDFYEATAE